MWTSRISEASPTLSITLRLENNGEKYGSHVMSPAAHFASEREIEAFLIISETSFFI